MGLGCCSLLGLSSIGLVLFMLFNTSSIPMFNYCTQGGCGCQPVKGYTVRTLATVTYSVAVVKVRCVPLYMYRCV